MQQNEQKVGYVGENAAELDDFDNADALVENEQVTSRRTTRMEPARISPDAVAVSGPGFDSPFSDVDVEEQQITDETMTRSAPLARP